MSALTKEDKDNIARYQKEVVRYKKPSVTADIIALRPGYDEPDATEWRKNPGFSIDILMIRRGIWPHKGMWALPGGFLKEGESIEDCARREILEETGVAAKQIYPTGVFSKPGRDMRYWIISNAYVTLLKAGEGACAKGGDDAAEAKWLRIKQPTIGDGEFNLPFYDGDSHLFTIHGQFEEGLFGGNVTKVDRNPLAFDHAEIIVQSFLRMRAFDKKELTLLFLPEKFTLANFIDIYQYLSRKSLDVDPVSHSNIPNFRRQLTEKSDPILEPCEGEQEERGRGHATAKLYRRRSKKN